MPLFTSTSRPPHDHTYSPPAQGASRSPCPALNALSNHGYLPRDGRRISLLQLVNAVRLVYNLSIPLALCLSIVAVIKCGNWWSIDLHDLAKHNAIEHDGSLVHADAPSGDAFAPTEVDPALVEQLLSITRANSLSLHDLARARAQRDVAIRSPLDKIHAEIARGETVLTIECLGSDGLVDKQDIDDGVDVKPERRVPKAYVEEWFVKEKLPEGWDKPSRKVTLIGVARKSWEVKAMVHAMRSEQAEA